MLTFHLSMRVSDVMNLKDSTAEVVSGICSECMHYVIYVFICLKTKVLVQLH